MDGCWYGRGSESPAVERVLGWDWGVKADSGRGAGIGQGVRKPAKKYTMIRFTKLK